MWFVNTEIKFSYAGLAELMLKYKQTFLQVIYVSTRQG